MKAIHVGNVCEERMLISNLTLSLFLFSHFNLKFVDELI